MSRVWDLVKQGEYEQACCVADDEFSKTSSLLALRNKVFALLCLQRLPEAVSLGKQIIKLTNGSTDSDFVFLGASQWLLGQQDDAVGTWKSASACIYTDAAGGVEIQSLLFFASAMLNDTTTKNESIEGLFEVQKRHRGDGWPSPIASFLLEKINEDEFLTKLAQQPVLRAKQGCQANFYIGIRRRILGDDTGFVECIRHSCEQGKAALAKAEFYLAKHLLTDSNVSPKTSPPALPEKSE